MAKKEIKYGIGFDINKSGLEDLKKELKLIQSFTATDLKIFDPSLANKSIKEIDAELKTVHNTANDIQYALEKSFNPKLNTISLQNFQKYLAETGTKTIPQAAEGLKNIGDVGKQTFSNLTNVLMTTKQQLRETTSWADKLGETLTNTVRWKIASGAIDAFTGNIQSAWNYAKKLDSSLNDIRIVTNKSADDMERFAKQANKAAKSLGASTTNYTNAALIYYQQGLSEDDVAARTNVTVKAANVTGQSASEVSEQLTAVWNGYKVVAEEAELYVDKLAAVAASTAADLEELSTGMSKVASAAATMGVNIDQLSAQLSTIVSVTRQDASVVGTALKTIYARMGDLKVDGVDEFGTSLGDVSGQLKQMGINVLDQEGNLRDMGEVIEEVAEKWGVWTDAQRQAAAVAIAGKRQYNNLIALFENWDMYESSLTTSQNSAGTLQKQQDIYMDSIEAHLKQLTVASEKFWDALINNDAMNSFIDLFTGLVDLAGNFTESIGGAIPLLMSLTPLVSKSLGKNIGEFVSSQVSNFKSSQYNKRELATRAAVNQGLLESENAEADPLTKEWLTLQEQTLEYSSVMSVEEQNAANERLVKLGEEIKLLKEKENLLKNMIGTAENDPTAAIIEENKSEIEQLSKQRERATQVSSEKVDELNRLEIQRDHLVAWRSGNSKNDYHGANGVGISGITKDSSEAEIDAAAQQKFEELVKQIEEKTSEIKELNQKEEALSQKIDLLNATTPESFDVNMSAKDRASLAREDSKKLTNISKEASGINRNLAVDIKGTAKAWEDLTLKLKQYNNVTNDTKIAADRIQEELNELENGAEYSEEEFEDLQNRIDEIANSCDKTAAKLENFAGKLDEVSDETENVNQNIKQQSEVFKEDYDKSIEKTTQKITQIIGYISSFAAAIQMLQQVGTIWNNEDVSMGEKILQTIPIITSLLLMSIPIITSVGKIWVSAEKEKQEANVKTAATAWASLGPYLAIAAIIVGILAVLIAIIAAISAASKQEETALQKAEKAFEKSQERAEEAKQKVKELRDEYNNLINDMNALHDAKNVLDDLRVGTTEWQEAVAQVNDQVVDLISKYPSLAQFFTVDENGVYGIEQEGWDQLAQQQRATMKQQQKVALATSLDTYVKKEEVIKAQSAQTTDDLVSKFDTYSTYNESNRFLRLGSKVHSLQDPTQIISATGDQALIDLLSKSGVIDERASGANGRIQYLDVEQLENLAKNGSGIEEFLGELETLEVDEEYKTMLKDVISNVSNTNKELASNNAALEASTKAYLSELGSEKGYNSEVYTNLTKDNAKEYISKGLDSYREDFFSEGNHIKVNGEDRDVWGDLDNSGDYKIFRARAKEIAKAAFGENATVSGLTDGELKGLKTSDVNEFTFEVNGQTYSIDQLLTMGAQKKQQKDIDEATETQTKNLDKLKKLGYSEEAAYFMSGTTLGAKDLIKDWEGANLSDVKRLKGYSSELGSYYSRSLYNFEQEFKKESEKIFKGTGWSATNAKFDLLTLDERKDFVNNLSLINSAGGNANDFFASINDPTTLKQVNSLFSETDFSSAESVNNLKAQLKELGVDTSKLGDNWTKFIDGVTSGTKQWITNSEKVIENLKTINSLAKDLSVGDIISEEDFEELKKIAPEIESMFIKTADGMKLLAGGDELTKALKQQYGTLADIETKYEAIRTAAAKMSGDSTFSKDTFKTSGKDNINSYFTNTNNLGLLEAVLGDGYNEGFIKSQLAIITDKNADTSSTAYVNALDTLSNYAETINQVALDAENGIYSSNTAREIYATSVASNWKEAKSALIKKDKAEMTLEDQQTNTKIIKNWGNSLFAELGFESTDFFNATEENVDKLQSAVEGMRKAEINQIGQLERAIDKAYGSNKISKLNELATEQKYVADAYKEAYTTALEVNSEKSVKVGNNTYSINSNMSYADLIDIALNAEDESMRNWAKGTIEYYDKWQENLDSALDTQIEAFNTKIEIRLDFEEAKKDWTEFKQKYLGKEGLSLFDEVDAATAFQNAKELYDLDTESFTNAYNDLVYLQSDAGKAEFGDNDAAYQEALKNAEDRAKSTYESLYENAKAMYDSWLQAEEEIMAVYDEQIAKLDKINSIMSSSANLMKLLGQSTIEYYAGMSQIAIAQQQSAQAQFNAAKEQYDLYYEEANEEMKKTLEENLSNAAKNAVDKGAAVAEALATQFSESLTSIVDDAFGGVGGLQSFSEAWERETIMDDRYLDEVNAAYAESELIYNIQKSIDQTDNLSAQKKLNDFREKELAMLKEKDKLTQADFDRANARYELLLKQIALEEAQQTANKMKLTRDASGNYTYQYVADQDAIAEAEHEVAAAENNLYNLNKDQEKELIDSLQSEYTTAIDKISNAKTAEDRQAWYDFYFGENGSITLLKEDLAAIRDQGAKTGTYNDSKYTEIIDRIMSADISKSGINMQSTISSFNTEMSNLSTTMTTMFGKDGSLTSALVSLAENSGFVQNDSSKYQFNVANSSGAMITAASVIDILYGVDGKGGVLDTLDTKLQNLVDKVDLNMIAQANAVNSTYQQAADDQVAALGANTQAILTWIDKIEDDGITGKVTINNHTYSFGDDGVWTQNANDSTQ